MSRHPLTRTLEYRKSLKDEITDEEIECFRQTGDDVLRDKIIGRYMQYVLGLARRLALNETAFEELASEGLKTLTISVIRAAPHLNKKGEFVPGKLLDNNMTPFVRSRVRRRMRDFILADRIVFMPGRTFRAKVQAGEITEENPFILSVVDLLADDVVVSEPEARKAEPGIEVFEALELAIHTDRERRVIDLRAEGYKYREIGEILGCSTSLIGQLMGPIEERFMKNYA